METQLLVVLSIGMALAVVGCGSGVGNSGSDGSVMMEAVHFLKQWGSDGTGPGQFSSMRGLALDDASNVYTCEFGTRSRVQKFRRDGKFLLKWGGHGTLDGPFERPISIEVGPDGTVSVADVGPDREDVQQFTGGGTFLRKFGGEGTSDGQFVPQGVAADPNSGNLYVADGLNSRIQKFTPTGSFLLKWGSDGTGAGWFDEAPKGVTVGPDGKVYVTDPAVPGNDRIHKFGSDGTFIKRWVVGDFPFDVSVDTHDNVWVTSYLGHHVERWKKYGVLKESFGSLGGAPGQFNRPTGIHVSPDDKIYVAEENNHRVQKFRRGGT